MMSHRRRRLFGQNRGFYPTSLASNQRGFGKYSVEPPTCKKLYKTEFNNNSKTSKSNSVDGIGRYGNATNKNTNVSGVFLKYN